MGLLPLMIVGGLTGAACWLWTPPSWPLWRMLAVTSALTFAACLLFALLFGA